MGGIAQPFVVVVLGGRRLFGDDDVDDDDMAPGPADPDHLGENGLRIGEVVERIARRDDVEDLVPIPTIHTGLRIEQHAT